MAEDNKGFLYERKINADLKKYKVYPGGYSGAGSDSNAPDAFIRVNNKDLKVEVKLDMKVDFGQGSLDYDLKNKKWILGGAQTQSAIQMRKFLESIKVPNIVNKAWGSKGPPRKFTVPFEKYTKQDVAYDYKNFTDTFVNISNSAVSNYYNSKNTYYIQIGDGYGLYYMGKDIAKLGVKPFFPTLKLRIRLKRGGISPIYNYRFSTAIQAATNSLSKSNSDLDDILFLKGLGARNL